MSKKQGKKLSVPRELEEIERENSERCFRAGLLQYQIRIYSKELDYINNRLEAINREAAARKELNAQKQTQTQETPSAQN